MDDKKETKHAEKETKKDPKAISVNISYEFDLAGAGANHCKATANYNGQEVVAFGADWKEAKANVLSRCGQAKAAGEPPPDETVEL